jgi:hypothetical protein
MKYKIQFILDKQIPTDRLRDIKLTLLNDEVDMSLISDYPILIPDDFIYLSSIKFSILKKEVKITNGFFTTEITILDTETLDKIREEADKTRRKYEYSPSVYKRHRGVTF